MVNFDFKFKVGDIVTPKTLIPFTDGTKHKIGDKIEITPECLAYFHVCEDDYNLVNIQKDITNG